MYIMHGLLHDGSVGVWHRNRKLLQEQVHSLPRHLEIFRGLWFVIWVLRTNGKAEQTSYVRLYASHMQLHPRRDICVPVPCILPSAVLTEFGFLWAKTQGTKLSLKVPDSGKV